MRGQNQSAVKQNNRNLILEYLMRKAPVSRIELSKMSGLSKMSVTNIINELLDEGLLFEAGREDSAFGRKPTALKLRPESKIFAGVYISRNKLCTVAGDICGTLLYEEQVKTPKDSDSLLDEIFRMLDFLLLKYKGNIESIGVCSIGPLDIKKGKILNPPNFYGIENIAIADILKKRYRLNIYLDKDTNAAALSERLFGKARSVSDYLYVGVTNGVGAAVVSRGSLYHGADGFVGEIGHVTVDINGERCSCGNIGCLEMYASVADGEEIDFAKCSRYLAAGLVTLVNLFDPSVIYLGHDIAKAGNSAAKALEREINSRFLSRKIKKIKVEISAFGERSPVYGAFALAAAGYIGKA